jgi:hypothetical protein
VIDESALPRDWTLERVRSVQPTAVLLDPAEHLVVYESGIARELRELQPAVIIGVGDFAVVRAAGTGDWWTGQLDHSDGSITCWATYGDGLGEALRSL